MLLVNKEWKITRERESVAFKLRMFKFQNIYNIPWYMPLSCLCLLYNMEQLSVVVRPPLPPHRPSAFIPSKSEARSAQWLKKIKII